MKSWICLGFGICNLEFNILGMFKNRQQEYFKIGRPSHDNYLVKLLIKKISAKSLIAKVKSAFSRLALVPAVA